MKEFYLKCKRNTEIVQTHGVFPASKPMVNKVCSGQQIGISFVLLVVLLLPKSNRRTDDLCVLLPISTVPTNPTKPTNPTNSTNPPNPIQSTNFVTWAVGLTNVSPRSSCCSCCSYVQREWRQHSLSGSVLCQCLFMLKVAFALLEIITRKLVWWIFPNHKQICKPNTNQSHVGLSTYP